MHIELAKHDRMSESGSSLLRIMQNDHMPILDLLVRESLQNSLDASLPHEKNVRVDINIREYESRLLRGEFVGIEDSLERLFGDGKCKLIEIRDSNTLGLTGPLEYKDVRNGNFGNLLKLIYEISKPQDKEGAGGSWGLGKTIYFRVGIGLVIYYTRIEISKNKYESRLAACLVQDEKGMDYLLPDRNEAIRRGIAWWGREVADGKTIPVTNESEIEEFLKKIGVDSYKGRETGTSIIIPYIDEENLLAGIMPINGNDIIQVKPWWLESVSDYVRIAVQRWYAPRVDNRLFRHGKWLDIRVDDEQIIKDKMANLFKVIQSLYNEASLEDTDKYDRSLLEDSDVKKLPIQLRNVFRDSSIAGHIAYTKVNDDKLGMNPPINQHHPYTYLGRFDYNPENNLPIIAYTRSPGMIVGYENTGEWTDGIPRTAQDDFIIGIFVANSGNVIVKDGLELPLEEYFRKAEKADHTSWKDPSVGKHKLNIVSKVQGHTRRKIRESFETKGYDIREKKNLGLGKALADYFLPPENFGPYASPAPRGGNGNQGGNKSRRNTIKILGNPRYDGDGVELDFEIIRGRNTNEINLELVVIGESMEFTSKSWESEFNMEFPLRLKKLYISEVHTSQRGRNRKPENYVVTSKLAVRETDGVRAELINSEISLVPCKLKLNFDEKVYKILGILSIESYDRLIKPGINIK